MLSRIITRRLAPNLYRYSTSRMPPHQVDVANIVGLQDVTEPVLSFTQKLSNFGLMNMYNGMDVFSRQLLFTLANDYALGAGVAILIISIGIKAAFLYPAIMGQANGIKMKALKKDMERFQQRMKVGQMTQNRAIMKAAQIEFSEAKRKKGIDNFITVINFIQIPFLITWFFSLRYITTLPELYPQLQNEGFLWFTDLTAYDPYFVLPILSAVMMSYSIAYSPTSTSLHSTNPALAPVMKYLKFMPLLTLPVTGMFPAAITLYWMSMSLVQMLITIAMNTRTFQKSLGLTQEFIQPKIIKAVIVEDRIDRDPTKPRIVHSQPTLEVKQNEEIQHIKLLKNKPKSKKK